MAFDPTKPVEQTEIDAAELRNQFNALKALIDAQAAQIIALQTALNAKPSMDDVNAAIAANSSANSNSVDMLDLNPSDPPTQNDVYSAIYRLNVLIGALHRQA